jgi:cell wall-associated NlpC family hydrolase
MQWAFDQVGKDLPRTSAAQSRVGRAVTHDQLQPGDLIFFNSPVSHVAIYAGNGQMVEAPNSGNDVRTASLSRRLDDVSGYRRI